MNLLLDTCTVSEMHREDSEPRVVAWMDRQAAGTMFLSVITLGELRFGADQLAEGQRKRRLEAWLVTLKEDFAGRILPVDEAAAERWGSLSLVTEQAGQTLSTPDLLIASTAIRHGLTVATRNVKDFEPTGVAVVDPWGG